MEKYQFEPAVQAIIERSRVPFAVFQFLDGRTVTVAVSDGFRTLFGFDSFAEVYGMMERDLFGYNHPDDVARIADSALCFATEGGSFDIVYRTRAAGEGSYMVIHALGEHISPAPGVRLGVVWYAYEGAYSPEAGQGESDLNRAYNHMIRELNTVRFHRYDALTGLPNMTYFFELSEITRSRMWSSGQTPAILFFDLGGMKSFNRANGFAGGDQLLREFSRTLANRFGSESCGRFGQDHFAVCTDSAGVAGAVEEIFRTARTINEGKTLPVRAGVYLDREKDVEISAACDRAKMACDAKRSSRVSVCAYFDSEMLRTALHRQYIIDSLDEALEKRRIQVYFQPIVRTASGRVCDEEALARWIDPEKGFLSPADFIPILEDARLIYKLDLYMVERVLEKLNRQRAAGQYVVPVSINLSRSDFDACDMVEEIRRRVDEAGFRRDILNIEITESVIGSDFDYMKEQVERFRLQGFHVWMDDFGSGYSSLDLLQSVQFDLIKFDMHFMRQFDRSDRSRIILTELLRMTAGLGLDTVVEGVEKEEQLSFLQEIGCTMVQGFYFCKPIPEEEILRRYENGRQIGFEDPDQADYYASLGRINLYDLSAVANDETGAFRHYFDTLPMAIMEAGHETFTLMRCNRSYRDFMERTFGVILIGKPIPYTGIAGMAGESFIRAVSACGETGDRTIFDERIPDGALVHAFLRRIAVNPVTGTAAVAVAVLAVS